MRTLRMQEDQEITKEIATLEKMNDLIEQPPAEVVEAKLSKTPLEDVERSLSDFTRDSFDLIRNDFQFREELKEEFRKRLQLDVNQGGISSRDFLGFFNSESVNMNDRISKVLGPTFQLMTAEQQAIQMTKQAELKANSTNIQINNANQGQAAQDKMKALNASEQVDQQTLQGMTQLANILQTMMHAAEKSK